MGAMTPGNDISMTQVVIPARCEKCHARFVYTPRWRTPRIDEKWCDSCNNNPTTDIMEDDYWRSVPTQPYVFGGWKFKVSDWPTDPDKVSLMRISHSLIFQNTYRASVVMSTLWHVQWMLNCLTVLKSRQDFVNCSKRKIASYARNWANCPTNRQGRRRAGGC